VKQFNGVKVFSATMWQQRELLGETVSAWLAGARARNGFEVVDILVRQSSDNEFHCIAIIVFFVERLSKPATKIQRAV
jgi:hypothetical protein